MHLKIAWSRKIVKYDNSLVLRYMKDMKLLTNSQYCYTATILRCIKRSFIDLQKYKIIQTDQPLIAIFHIPT